MDNLLTISGVRGYVDETGTAHLNLEDVARGLGFTQIKSGSEYVRWETITGYLGQFGFSQLVGKDSFIPENVFYRLAMKARNAVAETFQAKVADEILPAIRKHGGYLTPEKIEEALLNPDTLIQLATQLKTERVEKERLRLETERKAAVITEQTPKVNYHDQILASEGTLLVTQIAKDYCLTAVELNLVLKAEGVQYKRGNQWVLKADYSKLGYTDSLTYLIGEAHSTVNTKWTQTGRLFIHRLLERVGIKAGMGPDAAGQMYLAEIKQREQEARKKKLGRGGKNKVATRLNPHSRFVAG